MKAFLNSPAVDLEKQQEQPQQGQESSTDGTNDKASSKNKLVLVFGREEEGLRPEEVIACTAACSIPIGRLQESLSLSHAVSLVLAPLFEARQESLLVKGGVSVDSREDLAAGVETQDD
jgi:tRNA C32,U32 (ribose-2'-O)-methylase TrmJ